MRATPKTCLRFVDEVIGKVQGVSRTRTVVVPWKLKDIYQWRIPETVGEKGGGRTLDQVRCEIWATGPGSLLTRPGGR